MSRSHSTILLLALASLASACSEDIPPPVAAINYHACTGMSGSCGAGGPGSCCANSRERNLGESYNVTCIVVPGTLPDSYLLDFTVSTPRNDDPAIYAEGLTFSANPSGTSPVTQCSSLTIREGGNRFTTGTCDRLDTPPDEGGGCELELRLDDQNTVEGRFQCKELPLGSGNLVFSTVRGGNVDWGGIQIQNCSVRL